MRLSARVTFWHNHYPLEFNLSFIRFLKFRMAIRPNWDKFYNMTNLPTTLHLSQMKQVSGSHYFLCPFTDLTLLHFPVTVLSLREWKLVRSVLRHIDVGRIYSSIARNLNFDWSIQVMWKRRATELLSFLIPVGAGSLFLWNRLLL